MIIFAFPDFEAAVVSSEIGLLRSVPKLQCGRFRTGRFENGELVIDIETPVARQDCIVLGSISPPEENLARMLLLAHTLRKEGAAGITAVIPYLAYSRQDKNEPARSLGAAWAGALLKASGFDRVVTIDVHSEEDTRLFPLRLISLSPASVFGAALKQYQLTQATIIAPDKSAIPRCAAVRAAAGLLPATIPWFEKHRDETGIRHTHFSGEVGTQAVLVDDILDTGATLISACDRLLCAGVEDIEIMVTHALFTGREWEGLWELAVSRIFCLDTVPLPEGIDTSRIVRLSAVPILATALE